MIRSLVPPDGMPVEAHIFTDGQKSSMPMPFSELAVPPGTKLVVHSVVDRTEPNCMWKQFMRREVFTSRRRCAYRR